jgi:hypothetical protein
VPDTYGVVPADISSELKGLYPQGFSGNTVPTYDQVVAWISTADAIVSLRLVDETGQPPASSDAAAGVARTFIREWVKAQVVRAAYAGNDPLAVASAAKTYSDNAGAILLELDEMGSQAIGTGTESARVAVAYTIPDRELTVTDDELDMDNAFRTRKY